MTTLLDSNQVLQHSFSDADEALKIVGTGAGGSLPVTISSAASSDIVASYNIPYTSLTTSYYQVVASSDEITKIAIYDTSGQTIELALGGSGSEVVYLTIGPGNDQVIEVNIPAGTRIAVRADSNATAGSLILNCIGPV